MNIFYRDLSILRDVAVFNRSTRHTAVLYGIAPPTVRKAYRRALKNLIQRGFVAGIASTMIPMGLLRTSPLKKQVWNGIARAASEGKPATSATEGISHGKQIFRLPSLRGVLM